ncbi:mfs multidrug transporter [Diplodia corticola]|uniref:Mfs multidrug transporter n=1 Tax=Diplodia corticola TaxID=236234 RepID=A0A1J9S8E5_9PEZI|nr:mfs multidrug transporter [Diplodia corticola]OJD36188.1 mfs multidrug transporter [Diplodia corticola]
MSNRSGSLHLETTEEKRNVRDKEDFERVQSSTAESRQKASDVEIVDWDGPDDAENPFNWSKRRKWLLTITTCFISILTGLSAGAYGGGNEQMETRFNISQDTFPTLFWATTSWNVGRMPGYFGSYIMFLIWMVPSAVAKNFATLIITRFFDGGFSSVSINIPAHVHLRPHVRRRHRAGGPFIGSAIAANMYWRWICYIQPIFDAGCLPLFWFILNETRADVILARRARRLRKSGNRPNAYAKAELEKTDVLTSLKISFTRPVKMLATEWVVFLFTLWISFAWGILFLFQSSIVQTLQTNYGFGVMSTGLIQLALSAGALLGTILNPLQDALYLRSASAPRNRNRHRPGRPGRPGRRPIPSRASTRPCPAPSLLFAASLFWYGWSLSSPTVVHFLVPAAAVGLLGIYSIYLAPRRRRQLLPRLADSVRAVRGVRRPPHLSSAPASLGRKVVRRVLAPRASGAEVVWWGVGVERGRGGLLGFVGLGLSVAPAVLVLLWKGEEVGRRSPFVRVAAFDGGGGGGGDDDDGGDGKGEGEGEGRGKE